MKNFFRVKEVASNLSVSPSTVWRWVREEGFPKPTKLGARTTVWSLQSVEKFLDEKNNA